MERWIFVVVIKFSLYNFIEFLLVAALLRILPGWKFQLSLLSATQEKFACATDCTMCQSIRYKQGQQAKRSEAKRGEVIWGDFWHNFFNEICIVLLRNTLAPVIHFRKSLAECVCMCVFFPTGSSVMSYKKAHAHVRNYTDTFNVHF